MNTLLKEALEAVDAVTTLSALDAIRVDFLGKKGRLTELLKGLVHLSAEDKPKIGQWVNQAKRDISTRIEEKTLELKE
ncbi:MAG: phenylalanine--tRNA ligase subunit alpha, partial [Legionellaceae bacterium]